MPGRIYPHPEELNGNDGADNQQEDPHEGSDSESEGDGDDYDSPDATSELVELRNEDFSAYFSERNGRLFHSSPIATAPYPLPVDTPEQERLTNLTTILHQVVGALNVGPVDEVLARQPNPPRCQMVLDACTGNGRWVMWMAQAFPHVHFRGFDIGKSRPTVMIDAALMHRITTRLPSVPIASRYPLNNVWFELHNVNMPGPSHWLSGTFDLINSRFVDMAVLDYGRFSQQAARLLRPGGLFLSYEWSRIPAFATHTQHDPSVHAPASTRFYNAINAALVARGVSQLASRVPGFLRDVGEFTDITDRAYHVPIGPWPADPALRELGILCLQAQEQYARSIRPLLTESGWAEEFDNLVADYIQEINNVPGLVSILYTVHARRL